MRRTTRAALVDRLEGYDTLVEVGIGRRVAVARDLATAGVAVTATDVQDRDVPESVAFVRDDLTAPDPSVYAGASALYALNCPPELHRPLVDVAESAGAACHFTTLGGDPPSVPVTIDSLPGETLYTAKPEPA